MFIPHSGPSLGKVLGYVLYTWLFRENGRYVSSLDGSFFGPSRGLNDYDSLALNYKGSNVKPDKQYSILPTVLRMVGDCRDKVIIDIGCGSGFFTLPLAKHGARGVYGVDNSRAQIELARTVSEHPHIQYILSDVFVEPMTVVDIIVAPFVVNYARTIPILRHFFQQVYCNLGEGGKAVFVVDLPNGKSLKRFGATKTLSGPAVDETWIEINLWSGERKICTLNSVYYLPQTIENLLRAAGFRNIKWHTPIISEEGIQAMGSDFWKGYLDDTELGYLTAEK